MPENLNPFINDCARFPIHANAPFFKAVRGLKTGSKRLPSTLFENARTVSSLQKGFSCKSLVMHKFRSRPQQKATAKKKMTSDEVVDLDLVKLVDPLTGNIILNSTRYGLPKVWNGAFKEASKIDLDISFWLDDRIVVAEELLRSARFIDYYLETGNVIVVSTHARCSSPAAIMAFFMLFRGWSLENMIKPWLREAYPKMRPKSAEMLAEFPNVAKCEASLKLLEQTDWSTSPCFKNLLSLGTKCLDKLKMIQVTPIDCAYSEQVYNAVARFDLPDEAFHPAWRTAISKRRFSGTSSDKVLQTRTKRKLNAGATAQRRNKFQVIKVKEEPESQSATAAAGSVDVAQAPPVWDGTSLQGPSASGVTTSFVEPTESRLRLEEAGRPPCQSKETIGDIQSIACHWWVHQLKPEGWNHFCPKPKFCVDFGFIPGCLLKKHNKAAIVKFGKPGVHYALGWEGLYHYVKTYGKCLPYEPGHEYERFVEYVCKEFNVPELAFLPMSKTPSTASSTQTAGPSGRGSQENDSIEDDDLSGNEENESGHADDLVLLPNNEVLAIPLVEPDAASGGGQTNNEASVDGLENNNEAVEPTVTTAATASVKQARSVDNDSRRVSVDTHQGNVKNAWPEAVVCKAKQVQRLMKAHISKELEARIALEPPDEASRDKDRLYTFLMELVEDSMATGNEELKRSILGAMDSLQRKFVQST